MLAVALLSSRSNLQFLLSSCTEVVPSLGFEREYRRFESCQPSHFSPPKGSTDVVVACFGIIGVGGRDDYNPVKGYSHQKRI